MNVIKVKGVGYGTGFNSYPCEFEMNINFDYDNHPEEVMLRAIYELKKRSACNYVKVFSIEKIGERHEANN
jgi:hypothetical protein